uniref:Putative secreted protein n=1 Tax=Rhipicephalus microplus TaxID=6941 RepID=A0A6M2D9Q2_RHIMP
MCRNRCCQLHVVSSIVCMLSPCGLAVSSLSVLLLSTEHKLSASQETVNPRRTAHSGLCMVHPVAPALGLSVSPLPSFDAFTPSVSVLPGA